MRDLEEIRRDLDVLDSRMAALFEERMALTEEVAEYKIAENIPVLDEHREDEKLEALAAQMHSEENADGVQELYRTIFEISRRQQQRLIDEKKNC